MTESEVDKNHDEVVVIEKKASDLLLDIDDKLDSILDYFKDLKFKYELLLQGQKRLEKKIDSLTIKNDIVGVDDKSSLIVQPIITQPIITQPIAKPFPSSENLISSPKRTVRQKVFYPQNPGTSDGMIPVIMANVKIHNVDNQVINSKIKTDPKGVWTCPLEPGEYFYHVTKAPQGKKPLIDYYQGFTVPPGSADPIELQPHDEKSSKK